MKHIKKWLVRAGSVQKIAFVGSFGLIGVAFLLAAHAATAPSGIAVTAPGGKLTGSASVVSDSGAISGQAVGFGTSSPSGGAAVGGGHNIIVGVNLNGLGSNAGPDMAGAVKYVRADLKSWGLPASTFTNSGIKIDDLSQGPYSTSGISGLGSATTWASTALGWYQADGYNPTLSPIVEILNEPGGTWFWGSNATSTANATAYDNILIAAYNVFSQLYGSSRPLILVSFDGGYSDNSANWGQTMWQANSKIGDYIDGITVHPYDMDSTGLGNQTSVTNSYAKVQSLAGRSIPIYITEIGWQTTPTSSETSAGDTPQSGTVLLSAAQQCSNVYNFISWAKGLNYVNAVMIFDYRDDNRGDGTYGIEYGDGTHKSSYSALAAATLEQANPC